MSDRAPGERMSGERMIVTLVDGVAHRRPDRLAAEEPLELRVNGEAVSVTMRTPGHDFDLAVGFCLTEGIVAGPGAIAAVRYCTGDGPGDYNTLDVALHDPSPVADGLRRNVYTSSSCGVCGTASIDNVRKRVPDVSDDPLRVSAAVLAALPARLRAAQAGFDRTGGLHAAALFTPGGELVSLREDVGRHNAVDKLIGSAATEGRLPLAGHMLMVSGRVAFEIAQKALVAGVPMVVAISAPSSLAVSLAESAGMTVVGFLRGTSMNVYCGAERVVSR